MLQETNRAYKDHLNRSIVGGMPIANNGDKGTYFIDYEVFMGSFLSYDLSISVSATSDTITLNGANWSDFGITSGDTLNLIQTFNFDQSNGGNYTDIISFVDGNEAILTNQTFNFTDMFVSGQFNVVKDVEAIKTKINLIPNDQVSGVSSFVDSTSLTFASNALASLIVGNSLSLDVFGTISGGGALSAKITRNADTSGGNKKNYTLEISFYWWLYLTNFESYSFDVACVTPYIETSFFPVWNNPATALTSGFKPQGDGNSGFRDENFNQNVSNFELKSIVWDDGTNQVDGFDYSKPSFFEVIIENVNATSFGTNIGLILFNDIEDASLYSASQNNDNGEYSHLQLTSFTEEAFIPTNSTVVTFDGHIGKLGEKLSVSVESSFSGNTLTVKGSITPNQQFIDKFDNENYLDKTMSFLIRAESSSFTASNFSDTVNLLCWRGEAFKYPPILGQYFGVTTLNDHANNLIHLYL